jgi:hypothetical protein
LRGDVIGRTGPTAYLYKKTSHRNSFTFQDPTQNHTHFTKLHKQPIVLSCKG